MRVTVITNDSGELVGTVHGDFEVIEMEGQTALSMGSGTDEDPQVGVLIDPGQRTQEVEVSDALADADADDFLEQVRAQIGG